MQPSWSRSQMCVRRCRGSQKSPTRGHRCGAVPRSLPPCKASKFLGFHSAIQTMWQHIWRRCGGNMTCCWKPSPQCWMCSLLGSSCCIVRLPEPTTCCESVWSCLCTVLRSELGSRAHEDCLHIASKARNQRQVSSGRLEKKGGVSVVVATKVAGFRPTLANPFLASQFGPIHFWPISVVGGQWFG